MHYPTTGWMLFEDQQDNATDLLQPPVIHTSGNGWIYKPDEARTPQEIKRGTNKAWPRTRGYRDAHAEWHGEYMESQLAARGWKLPTKIEKPNLGRQSGGGNGFSINWRSEPWGWQGIELDIREPSSYAHNKQIALVYAVHTHAAVRWYENKVVENPYAWHTESYSHTHHTTDREEVRKRVREWIGSPWATTIRHVGHEQMLTNFVQPPVEKMLTVEYLTNGDKADDLEFYGLSGGLSQFWRKGKIEEVMKSQLAWKALQDVLKAFEFTGYTVRVKTEYSYRDNEDVPITAIEIDIPDDPDSMNRSRKTGHKVTLNKSGITVRCGFVADEKAWVEREKRKAKEHMALLEEDLFTEFSIDLNE